MLVDYAHTKSGEADDKRCDLPTLLKADLKAAGRSSYSVVAFTHLDDDHCCGASDFFHLEHASKYQGDGRHKIETLWVPAGAITEENLDGDARIIRSEARHRLRNGKGIKVFSRPERLKDWFDREGLNMDDFRHCFVDAGKLVGGFSLAVDGVEFFAHSPHALRTNERGLEDRNSDSLVFQTRFLEGGFQTDILFSGDVTYAELAEIVDITKYHENDDRLHWNVYHLPHHCSYTALGPDKGVDKTIPVEQLKWLCETQGEPNGYIISPSKPIPLKGDARRQGRAAAAPSGGRVLPHGCVEQREQVAGDNVRTLEHQPQADRDLRHFNRSGEDPARVRRCDRGGGRDGTACRMSSWQAYLEALYPSLFAAG
ncbi:MAG: hypothetical protein WDN49_25820 [Acetobacteraceae bacterium]